MRPVLAVVLIGDQRPLGDQPTRTLDRGSLRSLGIDLYKGRRRPVREVEVSYIVECDRLDLLDARSVVGMPFPAQRWPVVLFTIKGDAPVAFIETCAAQRAK